MNGNFRVGSLFGIPFYVNVSWFLVLALTTLNFGSGLAAQFPGLGAGALLLGLVAGLLLFGSVLLHELGHSFAAKQRGIQVNSITLFLFGGLASLNEEAKTPAGAFWIAVAGPLVSLGLFIALSFTSGLLTGPIAAIVGLLAYINLVLAVFNMIPGLPLDGGNVLKAIVWKLTNNRFRGIRWASRSGQVFGWLAVISGVLSVLGLSNVGSFWSIVIGWFLLQNAGQMSRTATIQEELSALTAADAVLERSPIIGADNTLRELANASIALSMNGNWQRFLVQDADGQLVGTVSLDVLKPFSASEWFNLYVKDFLEPIEQRYQILSNQSLLDAVEKLEQQQTQSLAVTGENGTLVGLLEKAVVMQLLQQKLQSKPA